MKGSTEPAKRRPGGRELEPGRVDRRGRDLSKPRGRNAGLTTEEEQRWVDPETGEIEWRWRLVPEDADRCRAWLRSGPWMDNQCTNTHIPGGVVCYAHGGKLPNVKKAAQRRLALAAFPAAERLIYIALQKPNVSDADRIKACLAILDRAGITGASTIEIEVKPWQSMLQLIAGEIEGKAKEEAGAEEGVDYEIIEAEWVDNDDV